MPILSVADYVGETPLSWWKPNKRSRVKVADRTLEDKIGKAHIKTCLRTPVLVNDVELSAHAALWRFASEPAKKPEEKAIKVTTLVKKQA